EPLRAKVSHESAIPVLDENFLRLCFLNGPVKIIPVCVIRHHKPLIVASSSPASVLHPTGSESGFVGTQEFLPFFGENRGRGQNKLPVKPRFFGNALFQRLR